MSSQVELTYNEEKSNNRQMEAFTCIHPDTGKYHGMWGGHLWYKGERKRYWGNWWMFFDLEVERKRIGTRRRGEKGKRNVLRGNEQGHNRRGGTGLKSNRSSTSTVRWLLETTE